MRLPFLLLLVMCVGQVGAPVGSKQYNISDLNDRKPQHEVFVFIEAELDRIIANQDKYPQIRMDDGYKVRVLTEARNLLNRYEKPFLDHIPFQSITYGQQVQLAQMIIQYCMKMESSDRRDSYRDLHTDSLGNTKQQTAILQAVDEHGEFKDHSQFLASLTQFVLYLSTIHIQRAQNIQPATTQILAELSKELNSSVINTVELTLPDTTIINVDKGSLTLPNGVKIDSDGKVTISTYILSGSTKHSGDASPVTSAGGSSLSSLSSGPGVPAAAARQGSGRQGAGGGASASANRQRGQSSTGTGTISGAHVGAQNTAAMRNPQRLRVASSEATTQGGRRGGRADGKPQPTATGSRSGTRPAWKP